MRAGRCGWRAWSGALAGLAACSEPVATKAPADLAAPAPGGISVSEASGGRAASAMPTPAEAAPSVARAWFVDVTSASGVDFVHDAGLSAEKPLPETMGAGAALSDVDEDGDLDLYLVQGGPMRLGGPEPGTFLDPALPLPPNRLFSNDGRARFRDVTAQSGDAADSGYGMGVAAADATGDGHVDFYVTNLGPDAFLVGDGRGRFANRTRAAGLGDERWTSAATFFDADQDGDLDLYVGAYLLVDLAHPVWCGGREPGWRSACHPDAYAGLLDRFWRNDGRGHFDEQTAAAGMASSSGKCLGVTAADFDGDGDLDVYTANDSVENRYWENLGRGTFRDATLISGTGVDERGATEAGMGLAVGDVDGDLDLDLFVTNFDNESNTLYENRGKGLFVDRTQRAGLDAPSRMPVGFGTVLEDFDGDGDLDLAVVNGHIIDNIHLYHDGKTHAQRAQLFVNDGHGRFREASAAEAGDLGRPERVGRGLYAGDLDGDGDPDLVATHCNGAALILRNDAAGHAGLSVLGLPSGTQVVARDEVGSAWLACAGGGTSYFGQSAPDARFGVAAGRVRSLTIREPGADPFIMMCGHAGEPPAWPQRLQLERGPQGWRGR